MAKFGLLKGRRNSQPQQAVGIDRNNKFAQNLKGLFTQAGTGTLFDVANSRFPSADNSAARIFNDGIGRDYSGTLNTQFANIPNYGITGAFTIVAILDVDALSNYGGIMACQDTTTTNGWEFRLGEGPTNSWIIFHRANAGFRQHRAGVTDLVAAGAKNVFIAVTCTNGLLETVPYFKVGKTYGLGEINTGTGTGSQIASTAAAWIGRRYDGSTQLDGGIKYIGLWDKAWSASELEELRLNPWQLFSPRKRELYVSVAGGVTAAITGQSIALAQGSVAATITAPLTGQSVPLAVGTVTVATGVSAALTGQGITAAIGSVSPVVSVALTGQNVLLAVGTVTVASGVSAAITGQSSSVALGSVSPVVSVAISGQSIPLSLGTMVPSFTRAITGQGSSLAIGNLSAAVAPPLAGQSITVSVGSVGVGGNVIRALTGQGLTVSLGNMVASSSQLWTDKPLSSDVWANNSLSGGTWTNSTLSSGTWEIR